MFLPAGSVSRSRRAGDRAAGRFVLTGSQKLHLMRAVAESLAGRAELIELEGLSWHEVHAARPGWTTEQDILRGGLPELAALLWGVDTPENLHSPSPLGGALWETYVFAELRRRQIARTGGWPFNFWRDRTQEVDFLFHRAGHFTRADAELTELTICRAPNPYPVDAFCRAVPVEQLGEVVS